MSNSKLKSFASYHVDVGFIFPSTLSSILCAYPFAGMRHDFSLCSLIEYFENDDFATSSEEAFDISVKSLATLPNLKYLTLRNMMSKYDLSIFNENNFTKLEKLVLDGRTAGRENLYNLSGIETLKTTLKSLTLSKTADTLLDFSPTGELTNLEELTIIDTKLSDDDFIENLSKLKTLNLSNNKVHSCVPFKNLLNLTSLNLTNNLIGQTSSGEDNLSILGNLNKQAGKGGNLEKLYLAGNSDIINFDSVSKLTWTDWSGFNNK